MNIKPLFAVAAIVFATSSAFAADVPPVTGPLTRAEVHQGVLDARAAGQLSIGDLSDYPYFDNAARSGVSRATVRNAAVAENATHPLTGEAGADFAALDGDDAAPSALTRATVHDEVIAARKAGTLPGPGDDVGYPYDEDGGPTGVFDASAHPRLARIGNWIAHRGASQAVANAD